MSWNITLAVKDGEVTVASKSGSLPEGTVVLYGHHNAGGNGFGMNVEGASASVYVPYLTPKKESK